MSKNNSIQSQSESAAGTPSISNAHALEYRIIRNDLIRVVVLNVLFLAVVLAVYYTDQQSHYLQRIYNQIF